MVRTACAVALSLSVGAAMALSAEYSDSNLRISGFGTVGLTHASTPSGWGFRRDISQPENDGGTRADIDSRLGVQINYSPTPQFELVGQIVAARRSSCAPLGDNIERVFAAYRPQPDVLVRIGRVNIDSFLLSDYRNVGFAYRFVRPPVEFYGSLPVSLDGIDVSRDLRFDNSRWRLKAFAGRSVSGDLAVDGRGGANPVFGVTVSRESDGLTVRLGFARTGFSSNAPDLRPLIDGLDAMAAVPVPEVAAQARELAASIDNKGDHTIYQSLGLNYEVRDWQRTLELTKVSGHPTSRFVAGYAGVGRRFGSVTLSGGVSRIRTPTCRWQRPTGPRP